MQAICGVAADAMIPQGDDIGMTQQSDGPEIQGLTQNHACLSTRHVYIAALLLKPDNSRSTYQTVITQSGGDAHKKSRCQEYELR
jgi:hypothetical protein